MGNLKNMDNNKEDTENIDCIKNAEEKRIIGKPIQPGQVLNPHGRPKKGTALADVMREYLDAELENTPGLTRKQAFVKAVYARAMKGGDAAQRLIWSHIDGMPLQKIEAKVDGKTKDIFNELPEEEQKLIADIYDRRTEG